MKRITAVLIALFMLFGVPAGCGKQNEGDKTNALRIVTTIFPEYDWVREILGNKADNAEITMLLDNGVDPHSYQPTADDIVKISDCDLFIYVGGESDGWVDDALMNATNIDMVVINLLDVLGDSVKIEEAVEGMQETEHDHDHDIDKDHKHEEEKDEHVWLSLRHAKTICKVIAEKLSEIDPDNKETYEENVNSYIEKLTALDAKYQKSVDEAHKKTVLFGDRFPFRYLVDDYGLDYYAAFSGCSAESEASFETIAFLAGKVNELNLKNIIIIEGSDGSIANTIVNSTTAKNTKVLTLNSMQTTTSAYVKNGVTYLSIMESNLAILTEALS